MCSNTEGIGKSFKKSESFFDSLRIAIRTLVNWGYERVFSLPV